jgi:hypothetical protein
VVISRVLRAATLLVPLALPLAARADDGVPPPGTILLGTFDHSLDSRTSDVLEPFTLNGVASDDRSFRGGRIFGHVTRVVKATKKTRGEIDFVFDAYISAAGRRYPIQGRATDLRIPVKPSVSPKPNVSPTPNVSPNRGVSPKPDVSPVPPLGVFGTGVVAMKPGTDVTVPPNTIMELELTP